MTPGGALGYPTTLESLSHVADSLHTRRGRCETGEKETLRISTDYAGFFSYVVCSGAEGGLMAPPAAARAMTDCAGMLFMSFSAAAWLQHPMTTPAFARGRLDVLGG